MGNTLFYLLPYGEEACLQEYGGWIGFGSTDMRDSLYVGVCSDGGRLYIEVVDRISGVLGYLGYDDIDRTMVLVDGVDGEGILEAEMVSNNWLILKCGDGNMHTKWVKASVSITALADSDDDEETIYELKQC